MNLFVGGVAVYGLFVGGLYFFQDRMIFPRTAAVQAQYPVPDGSEALELRAPDGHAIHGYLRRAPGRSRGLVIAFSGNAWNSRDCFTFVARRLRDVDIAVFHYRGYAPSEGEPSEEALFADALLIHDTLVTGMKPDKVVAIGFSLGSGVAAYLASKRPIDGQVLFTPFDSIEAVARERYKIVPVGLLLKHPFRSIDHLREVETPTAIVAASDDAVIPRSRTEALAASLRELVMFETVPDSTHGGIYDLEDIDEVLRRAVNAVVARSS